jgi:hypothetical protein
LHFSWSTGGSTFASATAAAETLASLGAGGLAEENFSAWWSQHASDAGQAPSIRHAGRRGE